MQVETHELQRRFDGLRIRCRAREERLAASMALHGQQSPVVAVRDGDELVLIDGYARCAALDNLGRDVVSAVELDLEVREALMWRHRMAATARRSMLEDAWLVAELRDAFGLSQELIGRRLMRSQSWVSRRLAMVRVLPNSVQEAVRTGQVPAHAAGRFLVPMARAIPEHCERLVAGITPKSASVRQLERLYLGWRDADPQQRERILEHPWLFLATADELEQETPEPIDSLTKVRRDLETAGGLCRRARRTLRDRMRVPEETGQAVHWAWQELLHAVTALRRPLEEFADVGQRHPDCDLRHAEEGAGHTTDRECP